MAKSWPNLLLKTFFIANLDVFAWKHIYMVNGGYRSQSGFSFRENQPKVKPRMQKRRPMNVEKYEALKNKVDKLLGNGFTCKVKYLI